MVFRNTSELSFGTISCSTTNFLRFFFFVKKYALSKLDKFAVTSRIFLFVASVCSPSRLTENHTSNIDLNVSQKQPKTLALWCNSQRDYFGSKTEAVYKDASNSSIAAHESVQSFSDYTRQGNWNYESQCVCVYLNYYLYKLIGSIFSKTEVGSGQYKDDNEK